MQATSAKAGKSLNETSKAMGTFNVSLTSMLKAFGVWQLGYTAPYKGIEGLKTAFVGPIAAASQFQSTMANVNSIIAGDSTDAIEKYKQGILDLTRVIPKDANDLGAGLYQVISAGITQTSDASEGFGCLREGFGCRSHVHLHRRGRDHDRSERLPPGSGSGDSGLGRAFVTVRDGKTTFDQLAGSMGRVVGSAARARVSIDEVGAAIVSLTKAGLSTDMAATALNSFLLSVVKASKGNNDAAKMAKQLGIEYNVTALKAMGLSKFIEQIQEKAGGSDVVLQTLTGNVRAYRDIVVLAGAGNKNFNDALGDMENKLGAADTAYQHNADTLKNSWQLAMNSMQASFIKAGEQQIPEMQKSVKHLTDTLNENQAQIEKAAGRSPDRLWSALNELVDLAPDLINDLTLIAQA